MTFFVGRGHYTYSTLYNIPPPPLFVSGYSHTNTIYDLVKSSDMVESSDMVRVSEC